VTPVRLELTTQ